MCHPSKALEGINQTIPPCPLLSAVSLEGGLQGVSTAENDRTGRKLGSGSALLGRGWLDLPKPRAALTRSISPEHRGLCDSCPRCHFSGSVFQTVLNISQSILPAKWWEGMSPGDPHSGFGWPASNQISPSCSGFLGQRLGPYLLSILGSL